MAKDIILKNQSGSKDEVYNIKLDKTNLEKKKDIEFDELEAEEKINYVDKIASNQEKIENFINEYQNIKDVMDNDEFRDFYQQVEDDAIVKLDDNTGIELDETIDTTINTLKINKSQGLIVFNNNYKINGVYYSKLNKNSFKDPHTFSMWIKPKSNTYSRKTILRNIVKIENNK